MDRSSFNQGIKGFFRRVNIPPAILQYKKRWHVWLIVFIFIFLTVLLCLPDICFNDPNSTVLFDKTGTLLGAKIAKDEQWRFPVSKSIPDKFNEAITQFEDKYFYYHPGFNPFSFARALYKNIRYKKIISGGSTITMQVIRLSRKNKRRTIYEKFIEVILALKLELTYSKKEILKLYASHAPFGSNVVGLDAAAWRYFGVSSDNLSWAEVATLAVLPNSPALIYPGKNRDKLLKKRNRLLTKLFSNGIIDKNKYELAKYESLPEKPFPIPQEAPHLLQRAINDGNEGKSIRSTIDAQIQENVNRIIATNTKVLQTNLIHNAAALVIEVNTGEVLAYTGNTSSNNNEYSNNVDIISSGRSTGSILKPYLFTAMINDGLILPTTLIPDIPTQIGGFIPENYNLTFDGAVPAKRALYRSLNIPAVKMLQSYGVEEFYSLLKRMGMTTLTKPSGHYGLSLILGGAEAKLWDIAGMYASMARTLNHFNSFGGKYNKDDFHPPFYMPSELIKRKDYTRSNSLLNAASIWLTFEAMVEASRPDEELQWRQFSSSYKIAWKTGTSFGNRDAWSIGVTPDYVVAVWVGNATGEGRPGLIGMGTAAPILFEIFNTLKPSKWFEQPINEMTLIPVCRYSGYRASDICEYTDDIWVPKNSLKTSVCPYHFIVHLDKSHQWQVNSICESVEKISNVPWFILPPVQESYFKNKNPFYKTLPPYRSDCTPSNETKNMDMIYPTDYSSIYIPVDLDGKLGSAVFKLAHRNPEAIVYWSLDGSFIGTTQKIHHKEIKSNKGIHKLTLCDDKGEMLYIHFSVLTKQK